VIERIREVEGWLLHVAVHLLAEVLESHGRRGHDTQVRAEGALCHWVRLVSQQSLEILLWVRRIVLLGVHPHDPVFTCTT
jgi:hypothetical protein